MVLTRAGRLREWSQGELRLYSEAQPLLRFLGDILPEAIALDIFTPLIKIILVIAPVGILNPQEASMIWPSPEEALLISKRMAKRLSICLIRLNEKHVMEHGKSSGNLAYDFTSPMINGEISMSSIIQTVRFADDQRRDTDVFYYTDGRLRR